MFGYVVDEGVEVLGLEVGCVVYDLCNGVSRQRAALQLEDDQPAGGIHAEQVERASIGRRLPAYQGQVLFQQVGVLDDGILQETLGIRVGLRLQWLGFRVVSERPYLDFVHGSPPPASLCASISVRHTMTALLWQRVEEGSRHYIGSLPRRALQIQHFDPQCGRPRDIIAR